MAPRARWWPGGGGTAVEDAVRRGGGGRGEALAGEQDRVGEEPGQLGEVLRAPFDQVGQGFGGHPGGHRRGRHQLRVGHRLAAEHDRGHAGAEHRREAVRPRLPATEQSYDGQVHPVEQGRHGVQLDPGGVGEPVVGGAGAGGEQVGVGGGQQQDVHVRLRRVTNGSTARPGRSGREGRRSAATGVRTTPPDGGMAGPGVSGVRRANRPGDGRRWERCRHAAAHARRCCGDHRPSSGRWRRCASSGPPRVSTPWGSLRRPKYPGSRIDAHPRPSNRTRTVVTHEGGSLPGDSGGTASESHRLPSLPSGRECCHTPYPGSTVAAGPAAYPATP